MFKTPVSILISGASQSGKSNLVFNILRNLENMFDETPKDIQYFYSEYQVAFDEFKDRVNFIEGIPTSPPDGRQPSLWIFDDLMEESSKGSMVSDIFTKYSHHRQTSCILIVQNFFYKGPMMRTISLNAGVLIIMRNLRDKSQILSLARQLNPTNTKFVLDAYKQATSRQYGYLIINLQQNTNEQHRYISNVFSEFGPYPEVYIEK